MSDINLSVPVYGVYGGNDYTNSVIGGTYGNGWGFGSGGNNNGILQARADYIGSPQGLKLLNDSSSNILGRVLRPDEVSNWQTVFINGGSIQDAIVNFSRSQEAHDQISKEFLGVLNRPATAGDWAARSKNMEGHGTLATIRMADALSQEAQNLIASSYQIVFGRAADAGGMAGYETALGGGMTQAGVRDSLARSAESQGHINDLYQSLYGRAANADDQTWAQNQLAGNMSLAQMRSFEAHNSEAQGHISDLYQSLYGRAANTDDQTWAQNQLASGTSLAQIRALEAHNPEARTHLLDCYQAIFGQSASDAQVAQGEDRLAASSLAQVRSDWAHSPATSGNINQIYFDSLGRAADAGGMASYENALGTNTSLQAVRTAIATSPEAYTAVGGIIDSVQNRVATGSDDAWIKGQQGSIANGSTLASVRSGLIDSPAENGVIDLIYPALHGHAAGQADYDYARQQLHGGLTIQQYVNNEAHTPQVRVSLNSLQQQITGNAVGQEFQAWNDWVEDQMGSGNLTLAGARINLAESAAANDALNSLQDLIFGKQPGQEFQAWNDWAKSAMGTGGQTLSDMAGNLIQDGQATTQVQSFIVSTKLGDPGDSGLIASGQTMLKEAAMAYQQVKSYSADQLQTVAGGIVRYAGYGSNILSSVLPNDTAGWVSLIALTAIDLTPPGEIATAGVLLAAGGAELGERVLGILESRIASDVETKSAQIVSGDTKAWAVDEVAENITTHAAKHIDQDGDFSLKNIGIDTKSDLASYIRDTINNAATNSSRYEIASDISRDRLAIWDKTDQTVTIFNPKTSIRDGNNGTVFRPTNGYQYFLDIKAGIK